MKPRTKKTTSQVTPKESGHGEDEARGADAQGLACVSDPLPPPPALKDRRARVRWIAELMTQGQWVRGQTFRAVAKHWGVTEARVKEDSTDASLMLDMLGDREALLQRVMLRLDGIAFDSFAETKDVIQSLRLMLEAAGLLKQHHVVEAQNMDSSEMRRRMVVVFRNPDPVTRAALEEAGWRYEPAIETEGSES